MKMKNTIRTELIHHLKELANNMDPQNFNSNTTRNKVCTKNSNRRMITANSKGMILTFKAKILIQVDQGISINYLLKNLMICFLKMELCLQRLALEINLRGSIMIKQDQATTSKEIICFIL